MATGKPNDPLVGCYEGQCEGTRSELTNAQGQLRDHEARLGGPSRMTII